MLSKLVADALEKRRDTLDILHGEDTDSYRIFHGAAEGKPGLTIDRYGAVLLFQTWREPIETSDIDEVTQLVSHGLGVSLTPVWNHRARSAKGKFNDLYPLSPFAAEGRELGMSFDARPRHRGIDPLLFLDFRAARRWVRSVSEGQEVLNLFAYTCGIGVAAALGGAKSVLNVDFATSSLEVGLDNAKRNGVHMEVLQEDALPIMRQLAGLPVKTRRGKRVRFKRVEPRAFDLVVLDPPRWATSAFGAVDLVRDYQTVFKPALLSTRPGGKMLVTNNVASVDRGGFGELLVRCAAKAGRPVRELQWLYPESDFPSFDGDPPLKMALLDLED